MRPAVLAAAAVAACLCAPAALAQSKADLAAVRDTSVVDQTGARLLRDTVTIKAPAATVWRALTDQGAYRAWAAPQSFIDFRIGGLLEVAFTDGAKAGDPSNLKQQIVAYLPQRLLVFHNLPSQGGPPGAAAYPKLAIVMELTARPDGTTEVSLSQVGYGTGADFDALYGFFSTHNPEYLASLKAFSERPR